MKRTTCLIFTVLLLIITCACGEQTDSPTWQEQYDLGVRYLSEGNYEEAILAFEMAIEIDPKRTEAYVSLSEAYLALGNKEQALGVLQEAASQTAGNDSFDDVLDDLINGSTYGVGAGNTTENVFNGGYSVDYNGTTYFLLLGDLYMETTDGREAVDLGVSYYNLRAPIFVSGNWLFAIGDYEGAPHEYHHQIIRFNFLTQEWQTIGGTNDVNNSIIGIWDNYIFYTLHSDDYSREDIIRMELDGGNPTCITTYQELFPSLFIDDGWIYYADNFSLSDDTVVDLPYIEDLDLYGANREYPNGRFMWGQIYRMDADGNNIQQLTNKELEERLGKSHNTHYGSQHGYNFVYPYKNKLYCGVGGYASNLGDENLICVSFLYCYDMLTGECYIVDDLYKNDREGYLNSTHDTAPRVLAKDTSLIIVPRIDGVYNETIILDLENGQTDVPNAIQTAIGRLLGSTDYANLALTKSNYYQGFGYVNDRFEYRKLDLSSGTIGSFSMD